ncbi:MAG: coproporphyrinogen dehydrogenase HemZ [Oscillospiraceae bacterium]|nr:coproporphyrinogen dehydrogenase HemZ [Oscillospiraceae bacterium]
MELILKQHDYRYAVEQIMLMLFPEERPAYPEGKPSGEPWAEVRLSRGETWVTAVTRLAIGGARYTGTARVPVRELTDEITSTRLSQRAVKLSFYRAAVDYFGKKPLWGALSGIRPAKLMRGLLAEGKTERQALRTFRERYDVSPGKAALCLDAARAAAAAEAGLERTGVCLYVGIPFCPSRCAYCSFVSQSVEKSFALMEPFLDALEQDIAATAAAVRETGLRVRAIYFGGGTPTTLSPAQLDRLCTSVERAFDLGACGEFTVEAGRPDTVTAEKLAVLRAHGVTRVSVNPQTMSDRVLRAIGRKHTASDVEKAMELVRAAGDFQVNMDLIAGLPEDTPEGFRDSVERVLALGPENVTVHTLALKKGSRITLEGTGLPTAEEVTQMVDGSALALGERGYKPYYLYRQKFMAGGLENVGWCLPGTENLYNIVIMEELRGVIAMGAGASTKLSAGGERLERVFAPKYPREYIDGIQKVCGEKKRIKEFYDHELFTD